MNLELCSRKAKEALSKILYLTLATCDAQGNPWNSPVYCAFDEQYNFYWASWTENQHSKNIRENSKVFGVIYDSMVPEGTGFGVYIQGKASQLEVGDEKEIEKACQLLYARKSKEPRPIEGFLNASPRRVFKFVPEKMWVNGEGDVEGEYVDTRIEITDLLL